MLAALLSLPGAGEGQSSFVTFESGQVRPLALSPDGTRLFAVNTPDDRLEIFATGAGTVTHVDSVHVGMEPVAVAARTDTEVWVVNHLSDSVSIVSLASTPPRVVRTLLVGDEPRDIVFAGPGRGRAFITTAHRGQNSPVDPALLTPGVGRADVWVFDANGLGSSLGGSPLTIVTLFGDVPRPLATSPDGGTVYVGILSSGNRTTALPETALDESDMLPPRESPGGAQAPTTGLIVKFDGADWRDAGSRSWSSFVKLSLPDLDVFAIDADANPPAEIGSASGVGTSLFNMAVNPQSGNLYVANTEARNHVRFEGSGDPLTGDGVRGHIVESRITVLDGTTVQPRHLNKHVDYSIHPGNASERARSLAFPLGMAVSSDGATIYVAAFGSGKVGVLEVAALEADTFVPDAADHVILSGGGPTGLALDEPRGQLYVLTRFDNAVSVVDLPTRSEVAHVPLHNPEPTRVVDGRPVLYDATFTSSHGDSACASCHLFGDTDHLAWNLGDPAGEPFANPNPFVVGAGGPFHPLKGPMTTQSLRGLANHGPMHWRGDRTGGSDPGGDARDEEQAFKKFIVAFEGLLGRDAPLPDADMQRFADFILEVHYPPNPIRNLDNSLTPAQQRGRDFYFTNPTDAGVFQCNVCHTLNPGQGFFGTSGFSSIEGEPQEFKVPHLRNLYQKVGMFGLNAPGLPSTGAQVRGFGYLHDGSIDTLLRFLQSPVFQFPGGDPQRIDVADFLFAMDAELAPIVGQQATLGPTSGTDVGARLDLMMERAAVLSPRPECDLVVKGTVGGEARGWVRLSDGRFRSDRALEPPLDDAELRTLAGAAGQELTYTAVPPGSGTRLGVDRDEDGFLDRDEIDAGSDPADAASTPGATAIRLLTGARLFVRYHRRPRRHRLVLSSLDPTIDMAPFGGAGDPTIAGGELLLANPTTGETERILLPAARWRLVGDAAAPSGYRYRDRLGRDGPCRRVVVKEGSLLRALCRGGKLTYTLDEPSQGSLTATLTTGLGPTYCTHFGGQILVDRGLAPGRRAGKFEAENAPAPASCPLP